MQRHEERTAWLFVSPVLLGILIFQIYPTLFSLFASFTSWNLISPPRWIGLENYVDLVTTDRFFFKTLWITTRYTLGVVFPSMALALFFAALLNQNIRFRHLYRGIYFIPVVAPTVALALLWGWLYEPNFGIINGVLRSFGIKGPAWLGTTQWALRSVIIMAIWAGLGFQIVIFLAGLQNISQEYYEAAAIDGANAWQKFVRITLPLLSPVTFFVLVTGIIGTFQDFSLVWVLTQGGPAGATQLIVMYLYGLAFRLQRMGLASAVAYAVFLIIVGLTILNFVFSKKWVFYEDSS
ncbi:MAG: sugar ABC transporter permease [Chloroflexi bacterium]|nr:MAG: sugar ABC transporter permease [Chloroflexota bacterium]